MVQHEILPISSILIQGLSVDDLERIISKVVKEEIGFSSKESKTQKEETKLLTRREAAKLLRISLPTLKSWTDIGLIKSRVIARSVYYTQQDIDKALKIELNK